MALMTYLSCNILEKLRFPIAETPVRVQKESYLSSILILETVVVVLNRLDWCQGTLSNWRDCNE